MQVISSYIEFILTQSDCVVIPGFGGFVLQEQAAVFSPSGKILPPSKVVSFNPAMQFNDGLLANLIMVDRNISFAQANNLVETFAKELIEELNANKTAEISSIGSFAMNEFKQIVFSPKRTNFDIDSYGFAPIQWDDIMTELVAESEDAEQEVETIEINPNTGTYLLKRIVAIIAVIFSFAVFNSPKMEHSEISEQQANLIELSLVSNISSALSKSYSTYKETEVSDIIVEQPQEAEIAIVNPTPIKRYYIIVSSIPSADLVGGEVSRLKAKGIDNATCLKKDNKFRMYVECFEVKTEAEQYLDSFRKSHKGFSDAWLLAHKSL